MSQRPDAPPVLGLTAEQRAKVWEMIEMLIAAELVIDGSADATAQRNRLYAALRAYLGFDQEGE